jgi:hypothetical protein
MIVASSPSRPGFELQQREELHAGRQPARKRSKAAKAASAFRVVASASMQRRHELGQPLARLAERIAG